MAHAQGAVCRWVPKLSPTVTRPRSSVTGWLQNGAIMDSGAVAGARAAVTQDMMSQCRPAPGAVRTLQTPPATFAHEEDMYRNS